MANEKENMEKNRNTETRLRPIEKESLPSGIQDSDAGEEASLVPVLGAGLYSPGTLSPAFTSPTLTALSYSRTKGIINTDEITQKKTLTVDRVNIISNKTGKLSGIGEQKLLDLGRSAFTKLNSKRDKTLHLRISADTKDFARACGSQIDPKHMKSEKAQEKENKRAEKALENFIIKYGKCGENLRENASFSWQEEVDGHVVAHDGVNLITRVRIDKDVTLIEFSLSAAEHMIKQPISFLHKSLYLLDDRSYNAFAIGRFLSERYSMDNNVINKTECIIKVKNLLAVTSLSYEKLGSRYRSRWESRIKEPFEEALDELYRVGLLKTWRYSLAGKKELADNEIITRYEQFESLYIYFEISDFPSNEERVKQIRERRNKKNSNNKRKK